MLKEILSISGKPGLFKLVSQGKNMYIVESLADRKRVPVYAADKVVSLGDIAIYTDTNEVPLCQVFDSIKEKEKGLPIQPSSTIQPSELKTYFETILPDFDREKVYPSDIKKIMNWYTILVNAGISEFKEKKEEEKIEPTENSAIA